jgi:nicotinate phosphoribosyltransferase
MSTRARTASLLFADFYQLTMAQLYFRQGLADHRAQFDYFFRDNPDYGQHKAGYCVCAGLDWFIDWFESLQPSDHETSWLATLTGRQGSRLFGDDFLRWLAGCDLQAGVTIRAIPEGRVVHPNEPVAVVEGPLPTVQIIESAFLNHLNYQTLVATKAARIREAAQDGKILEFGMRRAHEHGANAGARGALIGGADFSSNAAISAAIGLPPKGTHAHSMVQAFMALGGSELDAFRAYAEVFPDDCLLLVDTIDTLGSGVPNAIRVFEELRRAGHQPAGIRLDSGDLAYLAIQAAKQLDEAGFEQTSIVLSNNLDELVIWQVLTQIQHEAPRYGVDADRLVGRLVYGIGTRLITSAGDAALDGVFKLVAVGEGGSWRPAIKLSETKAKTINPGAKNLFRVYDSRGLATADLIAMVDENPGQDSPLVLRHPTDEGRKRELDAGAVSRVEALLVDAVVDGERTGPSPSMADMRALREADVARLHPGVKRLMNPHLYHVSLSQRLWDFKQGLVRELRRKTSEPEHEH